MNNTDASIRVTGMEIIFNPVSKEYVIETGKKLLDEVIKDHIQLQGEVGIKVEDSTLNSKGEIETASGRKIMLKNKAKGFKNIVSKKQKDIKTEVR